MGTVTALRLYSWENMGGNQLLHDRLLDALLERLGPFTIERIQYQLPTHQSEIHEAASRFNRIQRRVRVTGTTERRRARRMNVFVVRRSHRSWSVCFREGEILAIIEPNATVTLLLWSDLRDDLAHARRALSRTLALGKDLGAGREERGDGT